MTQIQKTILNDEITALLETIREQFETLNSFDGKIPILEFEIIKDNVRNLYEKLYLLQRMNDPFELIRQKEPENPVKLPANPPDKKEDEGIASVDSFVPPVRIIEEEVEPAKTEAETMEIDVSVSESPGQAPGEANELSETESDPVKTDLFASGTPDHPLNEKDKPAETKGKPVKVDLFTSETAAFNEKLKEAREQSLGPRFRQPNTGDIKSLININEKFLFINELFDGDYKEYTHTIEIFNNFDEKGEAFEFLDSLLKNNLWNSTSPAFLKLKEIIEKRFA